MPFLYHFSFGGSGGSSERACSFEVEGASCGKLEFVGRGDFQIPIHFLIKPAGNLLSAQPLIPQTPVNHLGEVPLKLVLKHSGFSSWRFHKALMARLGPLQSDVNRGLAISLRAVRRCDTDEDRALSDIAHDGHRLGVPVVQMIHY